MSRSNSNLVVCTLALLLASGTALAQTQMGTVFTYQGELTSGGVPVDEPLDGCNFEFSLWDADEDGSQVGSTLMPTVFVADGRFTVALDFGADIFTGEARFLEIAVCCPAPCGPPTTLTPRQELTPAPYSLHTPSAESVPWSGLTEVPDGFADDIDDDALGGLSCASGEIPKWDGAVWVCGEDIDTDTDTLAGLSCAGGQVAKWTGADWVCDDDEAGSGDGHSLDASDGDPVDALFVDAEGFVGIGTTTPSETLDVDGNIHASGTIQSGNSIIIDGLNSRITTTAPELFFDDDLRTSGSMLIETELQFGDVTALFVLDRNADGLVFRNEDDLAIVYFSQSLNVGIGTITPAEKLEVAGTIHSTAGGFKFPDGSVQDSAAEPSFWVESGLDIFYNGGDVGIGTAEPRAKLDVAGDISGQSYVFFDPIGQPEWILSTDLLNNLTIKNDAGSTVFAIADDVFNQLFASMTLQGELKADLLQTEALQLGDLLPKDCVVELGVHEGTGTFSISPCPPTDPPAFTITPDGDVGIGTTEPGGRFHVSARARGVGNGTISFDGISTTVTGSGTLFTQELDLFDTLIVPGAPEQQRLVVNIASDTLLTTAAPFDSPVIDSPYTFSDPSFVAEFEDTGDRVNAGVFGATAEASMTLLSLDPAGNRILTIAPDRITFFVDDLADKGVAVAFVGDTFRIDRDALTEPPALAITPDSNVGIGTATPSEKLEVAGTIHSTTGGFKFPDSTVQSTAATGDGDTLGGLSCASGQVAKWDGAAWVCDDDIDTDTLGALSCDDGQTLKWIHALAQWDCGEDDPGATALDEAYDGGGAGAGRTITADAGAVDIAGPDGLTVNGNVGIGTATPEARLQVVPRDPEVGAGTISSLGTTVTGSGAELTFSDLAVGDQLIIDLGLPTEQARTVTGDVGPTEVIVGRAFEPDLPAGSTYWWRVRTVDVFGNMVSSGEIVLVNPVPPVGGEVSVTSTVRNRGTTVGDPLDPAFLVDVRPDPADVSRDTAEVLVEGELVVTTPDGGGAVEIRPDSLTGTGVIRAFGGGGGSAEARGGGGGGGRIFVTATTGLETAAMEGGAGGGGRIVVRDGTTGTETARLEGGAGGGGSVVLSAPSGNLNVEMGSSLFDPESGFVGVADLTGTVIAGIDGATGEVFGFLKTFRMPHPNQPGTEIRYASLEGPEAGAYVRGTARLVNGRAEIPFPDHFRIVASSDGMTVQLTPLSAESKGLAVVHKGLDGIEVRELLSGTGSYEFDYTVTAVRNGYEDFRVIRSADEFESATVRLEETAILRATSPSPPGTTKPRTNRSATSARWPRTSPRPSAWAKRKP